MQVRLLVMIVILLAGATCSAQQQRAPEAVARVDGDPIYRLLRVGAIPAIDDPGFVSGAEADRQMRPDEKSTSPTRTGWVCSGPGG